MHNETGEYTDRQKTQLLNVSAFDWVVSDLDTCGFVCCQQQTVWSNHRPANCQSRGFGLTIGGLGGGPQRIGIRAWTSDQEWQLNIRRALLGERFDSDQWRGVKGSWDSSVWGTRRLEDTMPPLIGFSFWNIHCSLSLGELLCSESHN